MINSEFKRLIYDNPNFLNPSDVSKIENDTPRHFEENYSNYDNHFIEKTKHVNFAKKRWGPLMFKNLGITI